MEWTVVYLNNAVQAEVETLSAELRARFRRIVELILSKGLEQVRQTLPQAFGGPVVGDAAERTEHHRPRHLRGGKQPARRRAARFRQKKREDTAARLGDRTGEGEGRRVSVSRMYVPVEESFRRWDQEPTFRRAYGVLEDAFALAAELIDARAQAGLSQETVAERMRTSQQTISRLEGGAANPSLRTLRRFAQATGTKLRISFEPTTKKAR